MSRMALRYKLYQFYLAPLPALLTIYTCVLICNTFILSSSLPLEFSLWVSLLFLPLCLVTLNTAFQHEVSLLPTCTTFITFKDFPWSLYMFGTSASVKLIPVYLTLCFLSLNIVLRVSIWFLCLTGVIIWIYESSSYTGVSLSLQLQKSMIMSLKQITQDNNGKWKKSAIIALPQQKKPHLKRSGDKCCYIQHFYKVHLYNVYWIGLFHSMVEKYGLHKYFQ